MNFIDWLRAVDMYLFDSIGLMHDDLEDWLWHDAWEAGAKPKDEAEEFLQSIGFYQ